MVDPRGLVGTVAEVGALEGPGVVVPVAAALPPLFRTILLPRRPISTALGISHLLIFPLPLLAQLRPLPLPLPILERKIQEKLLLIYDSLFDPSLPKFQEKKLAHLIRTKRSFN